MFRHAPSSSVLPNPLVSASGGMGGSRKRLWQCRGAMGEYPGRSAMSTTRPRGDPLDETNGLSQPRRRTQPAGPDAGAGAPGATTRRDEETVELPETEA